MRLISFLMLFFCLFVVAVFFLTFFFCLSKTNANVAGLRLTKMHFVPVGTFRIDHVTNGYTAFYQVNVCIYVSYFRKKNAHR